MKRLTTFWTGCPNRPEFRASFIFPEDALPDLERIERYLVEGTLQDRCPVTGQQFRPEQHTRSAVDEVWPG